ncbi:unnamed protein product (macronuclear) [Paramecium tetraurelia]|uniref:Paired domain-containing protein n=1 Tax=Paramecium tetraurelia TaxID=5888 RepID=A0E6Q9_PARTE|nr:uncharacterized protein GSPATT00023704001 [Paramecium tetraurelia]CAK90976.1 unnamed protein product [Paramecium tetraurelia]|eukprot:XP_001458373.1 hypothetical protein (macronuclear) [Paramecium tetraurelia strain d4-2]
MKVEPSNDKVRSYCRVPRLQQQQLVNLVYKEEWKINQAAKLLNIKYATAKNIVQRFKKTHIFGKKAKLPESKRCQYKLIDRPEVQSYAVNTKSGLVFDSLVEYSQKA